MYRYLDILLRIDTVKMGFLNFEFPNFREIS
jgi:hypothetical protein